MLSLLLAIFGFYIGFTAITYFNIRNRMDQHIELWTNLKLRQLGMIETSEIKGLRIDIFDGDFYR